MMKTITLRIFLVVLCSFLSGLSNAASYQKKANGWIDAIDTKKRIIVLNNKIYHFSKYISVRDGSRRISIRDLRINLQIKYRTVKNKTKNRDEIREIWLIPL